MLTRLTVQNYALIEQLELDYSSGLTVITGETGSGKSILLGALGLLIGQRAETQALHDKTKKCVVEANFQLKGYRLKDFFKSNDLDYEDVCTIRREISTEGKSRAFINDTPVNLSVLKELSDYLIDIHSQHQTLSLNESAYQLSVVDAFCKHDTILEAYQQTYKDWKKATQELNELVEKEKQSKKDLDYFQFQFNELEDAALEKIKQDEMEQELQTLNNAETIKAAISRATNALTGGEQNLVSSLNEVKSTVASVTKFNKEVEELFNRLQSSLIELKDIAATLDQTNDSIAHDNARIETLNNQLDTLYRLQQKHQVKTVEELITIKNDFSDKLLSINSLEEQIKKLNAEVEKQEKQLQSKAKQLSANRLKATPSIEKEVKAILQQLGMPNAELKVTCTTDTTSYTASGQDSIRFLFTANKGMEARELSKVASGGELSRVMLAIKSLAAKLVALPTIIFDEIDTGVSGSVADKVGGIMEDMAQHMQVIAITHLPQIASKGTTHLYVYKQDSKSKTTSSIKKLNKEERITEVAKMLSNENPTTAAIKNAKELLRV